MTFSKLTWLKRTDRHKFTGAEFRVLLSIFNHSGSDGRQSHPGIDAMVEETRYRKTGISEALTSLKSSGWIHETYRGNGRAKRASVFDLVPDAPNPSYRCPAERSDNCSTCSNGSATAEVLEHPNGSAQAELLNPNGSGFQTNGSATAVPIVPLERLPTDPLTDPKIRSSRRSVDRPPDPGEFRYPPEQLGIHDRSLSAPVASTGRYPRVQETQGDRPEYETEPVSSFKAADAAKGVVHEVVDYDPFEEPEGTALPPMPTTGFRAVPFQDYDPFAT